MCPEFHRRSSDAVGLVDDSQPFSSRDSFMVSPRSHSSEPFTSVYSQRANKIREAIYWVTEEPDMRPDSHVAFSRSVAILMLSMTFISLISFVLETMPEFADTPASVWRTIEVVTTLLFSVEYLLRLWVCDVFGLSAVRWVFRPINVCDLVALAPLYLEAVSVSNLRFLHVMRTIRLFKLGRYSQGFRVMTAALKNSFAALYILVLIFFMGIVVFGSAVYFAERMACPHFQGMSVESFLEYAGDCTLSADGVSAKYGHCCSYACHGIPSASMANATICPYAYQTWYSTSGDAGSWDVRAVHDQVFTSIPDAMWWAAVTMTTVGYGEMTPKSWVAKLVASFAMVAGMLIIAMPFAIVGTKFGEAVAVYEDPDAKLSATLDSFQRAAEKKAGQPLELGSETASSKGSKRPPTSSSILETQIAPERFHSLQRHITQSMELKRKILRLQNLRNNLWTSAEHCMAELVHSGLLDFEDEMLAEDPQQAQLEQYMAAQINKESCEWSCCIFRRDSWIRETALKITTAWWFDSVILVTIFANSAILAMQVYTPSATQEVPWENRLQDNTEYIFLVIFTVECAMKIIAQGFVLHQKSYLHDPWNWIDFTVVVIGLAQAFVSLSTQEGNSSVLSGLRTVRMLRPLRTLTALPNMRKLVNTVLMSLPGLKDVVIMALFLLTVFGILGIQFWGGKMHRLCRVTPQPLHFTSVASQDPLCKGWCFDNRSMVVIELANGTTGEVNSSYVFAAFCKPVAKCEAAYAADQDYYLWPVEPTQDRFCGDYECTRRSLGHWSEWGFGLGSEALFLNVLEPLGVIRSTAPGSSAQSAPTWCGSALDDDLSMSPAVANSQLEGIDLNDWEDEVFSETFNWGITRYDQLPAAFLVIFQCVTLEGWVDIMYMLQDADSKILGFAYFLLLIVLGSFFLLNVTLAIVWDSFDRVSANAAALQESRMSITTTMASEDENESEESDAHHKSTQKKLRLRLEELRTSTANFADITDAGQQLSLGEWSMMMARRLVTEIKVIVGMKLKDVLKEPHPWRVVQVARAICRSAVFDAFILLIIGLNVLLLSYDQFPEPESLEIERWVGFLDVAFNVIFIIECLLFHVALGPVAYWLNAILAFDGFVVVISVWEMASASSTGQTNSGFLALRAFRLLRIVKLAKKFKSMRMLLKAGLGTLLAMREFVLLLFLIICVFALIGQSLFGGKFVFDPDTGRMVPPEDYEARCSEVYPYGATDGRRSDCIPRAHFDSFLWSCITIFQILTGENWNAVMYDGIKAAGWGYVFFFVGVIMFGNFVILNLFLAILMMHFSNIHQDLQKKIKHERVMQKNVVALMTRTFTHTSASLDAAKFTSPEPRSTSPLDVDSMPLQCENKAYGDMDLENVSEASHAEKTAGRRKESKEESATGGSGVSPQQFSRPIADRAASPGRSQGEGKSPFTLRGQLIGDHENSTGILSDGGSNQLSRGINTLLTRHFTRVWTNSFVLLPDNQFPRNVCMFLVDQPRFEQLMLFFIVLSSAVMCLSHPLRDPGSWIEVGCEQANRVFTLIFVLEMMIKIIAWGFLCGRVTMSGVHRPAYLRNAWNRLDFVIVTVSVFDVIQDLAVQSADSEFLAFMKIFRIARMLRPLRIISRNDNLKVVVRTIGDSMDELGNLMLFSSLFFVIFGLFGVAFFKGCFYSCVDGGLQEISFDWHMAVTPLCIPHPSVGQSMNPGELYSMSFASQADQTDPSSPTCPLDDGARMWEQWQRPTADTPICEVHCDATLEYYQGMSTHPFCEENHPWGYHVMRCVDCQTTFCPEVHTMDFPLITTCTEACKAHVRFCQSGDSLCLDECVAQCACRSSCRGLSEDAALCVEQGGRWLNLNQNFDNLGVAMISLFEISTTEGWVDTMLAGVDSRNPMQQPRRDESELAVVLFVAFILVGSFFVLNLCVGVIIDNYSNQKKREKQSNLTESQQKWLTYQKALYMKRQFFVMTNLQQLSPTRQHMIRIVSSPTFESLIMIGICLNTVVLGAAWYPSPGLVHQRITSSLDGLFAMLFNFEAAMKLSAMHTNYFKEYWNVFDFFCVFVSDAIIVIQVGYGGVEGSSIGMAIGVIRIFRIARLFRLVRFLKGLNQLFFAFILSMPKLFNVACIMFLLIYLYAILGVNIFGTVAYVPGSSYNEQANFRDIVSAVSVLVRSMTGEGWNEIMHDLSKPQFFFESYAEVSCVEDMTITKENFREKWDLNGDGWVDDDVVHQCGTSMSFVFFITYTLSVTFVILNLFIAVIFEGFEEAQSSKSEVTGVIQICTSVWSKYDVDRAMRIPLGRAFDFIDEVLETMCTLHAKDRDHPVILESRWDHAAQGTQTGESKWSLYNLLYIRMLALEADMHNEVRFVCAVKAVIRSMICLGGLNDRCTSRMERINILHSLEDLDRLMYTDKADADLDRLACLENKQARAVDRGLGILKDGGIAQLRSTLVLASSNMVERKPSLNVLARLSHVVSRSRTLVKYPANEYRLVEQVAAAKIQRRIKEIIQRKKQGSRTRPASRQAQKDGSVVPDDVSQEL